MGDWIYDRNVHAQRYTTATLFVIHVGTSSLEALEKCFQKQVIGWSGTRPC